MDGIPATAVDVIDGRALQFTLPAASGEGAHTLKLAAGALQDVSGQSNGLETCTFLLDTTAPTIVYSSIGQTQTDPVELGLGGTLDYTLHFSEAMDPSTDVWQGDLAGQTRPTGYNYWPAWYSYGDLPDGQYQRGYHFTRTAQGFLTNWP